MTYNFQEEMSDAELARALNWPPKKEDGDSVPFFEEEDVDELSMEDVDQRLEVASYYRLLLQNGLFEQNTPAAALVERRVANFVRGQLRELLGLERSEPKVQPLPFDQDEIEVLKSVASKLLRAAVPTAPKVTPVPAPEPPRAAPAVRKSPVPTPRAAPTPKVAAVEPKPALKTTKVPTKNPVQKNKESKAVKAEAEPPLPKKPSGYTTETGSIVHRDGRVFKVVTRDDGSTYERDVTPQQRPTDIAPLPTAAEITLGSAMAAAAHVQNNLGNPSATNNLLGLAVQASLKG